MPAPPRVHSVVVPVHMKVQVPLAQTWLVPQVVPQAPQFARSVRRDTHARPAPASPAERHSVSPVPQSGTQAPF